MRFNHRTLQGWRPLGASFARFSSVGLVVAAFNYVVFLAFLTLGLHYLKALLLAWILSVALGFALNRRLTFEVAGKASSGEVAGYVAASLFQLVLALVGFVALIDGLSIPAIVAYPINLAVVTACNFSVMRIFVFPVRRQMQTRMDHD